MLVLSDKNVNSLVKNDYYYVAMNITQYLALIRKYI